MKRKYQRPEMEAITEKLDMAMCIASGGGVDGDGGVRYPNCIGSDSYGDLVGNDTFVW